MLSDYINKIKEIETLVESLIGFKLTEENTTDIFSITNELMISIKDLYNKNFSDISKEQFEDFWNEAINSSKCYSVDLSADRLRRKMNQDFNDYYDEYYNKCN